MDHHSFNAKKEESDERLSIFRGFYEKFIINNILTHIISLFAFFYQLPLTISKNSFWNMLDNDTQIESYQRVLLYSFPIP